MERSDTAIRVRWKLTSRIVFAGFIILGLVLLLASQLLASNKPNNFVSLVLNQLATALLVGGLWTGVYETFLRDDFIRINDENTGKLLSAAETILESGRQNTQTLLNKISVSEQEELLGLVEANSASNKYDYTDLITNSKALVLLLNDGRTWVSNHADQLRRRFADPEKTTKIFLLHPLSPMIPTHARKVGTTTQSLQLKIAETIEMLGTLRTANTSLEVYGHYLYNPYSLFIGDHYAVLTTYFASKGRRTVPMFRFEDQDGQPDCYYKQLKEDVEVLKKFDAEEISNFNPDKLVTATSSPTNSHT